MLFWPFFIFIHTPVYLSLYFPLLSSSFLSLLLYPVYISWFLILLTSFTFLPVLEILIQGSILVMCAQRQPEIAGESHKQGMWLLSEIISNSN